MAGLSDIPPNLTYFPHSDEHLPPAITTPPEPALWDTFVTFMYRKYAPGSLKYTVHQLFPCLELIPMFRKGYTFIDFCADLVAGLTVSTLLIPQSLSYSGLANLPPAYGLYTALCAGICYFFLGSAFHVSIGPFALVSLMTAQIVDTMYPELGKFEVQDPIAGLNLRLTYTMTLTFLSGVYLVLMAVLKLGWIIDLFSGPSLTAFLAGAGYAVGATQIGAVTGIKIEQGSFLVTMISLFRNITTINFMTLLIGGGSLILIYASDTYSKKKGYRIPIPTQLLLVIILTGISALANLNERFNVKILGEIKMGFPTPVFPSAKLLFTDGGYWSNALLITASGFVVLSSISKQMGDKHSEKYQVNYNSELFSIGVASALGSFINSYPSSAAYSRTIVIDHCAPKSRIWGLWAVLVLIFVIFAIAPLLYYLPSAVLGAVVLSSFINSYLDWDQGLRIFRQSKLEGVVYYVTFLSTILINIQTGVIASLLASLASLILTHASWSPILLQQVPQTQRYVDVTKVDELTKNHYYRYLQSIERDGGINKVSSRATAATTGPFSLSFITNRFSNNSQYQNQNDDEEEFQNSSSFLPYGAMPDSADGGTQLYDLTASSERPGDLINDMINGINIQYQQDPRIIIIHIGDKLDFINANPITAFIERYNATYKIFKKNKEKNAQKTDVAIQEEQYTELLPSNQLDALTFAPKNLKAITESIDLVYNPLVFNHITGTEKHCSITTTATSLSHNNPFTVDPYSLELESPLSPQSHNDSTPLPNSIHQFFPNTDNSFPVPQDVTLGLLSPQQQHALSVLIKDTISAPQEQVKKLNKYELVVIFDFIVDIDLTFLKAMNAFITTYPHILFLFTNPSQRMVQKLNKFQPPTSYVFDNVYLSVEYSKYILRIAQDAVQFDAIKQKQAHNPQSNIDV